MRIAKILTSLIYFLILNFSGCYTVLHDIDSLRNLSEEYSQEESVIQQSYHSNEYDIFYNSRWWSNLYITENSRLDNEILSNSDQNSNNGNSYNISPLINNKNLNIPSAGSIIDNNSRVINEPSAKSDNSDNVGKNTNVSKTSTDSDKTRTNDGSRSQIKRRK